MAKKTIKLKKYEDIVNEETAAEAITPGQLVELKSDGEIQKHATGGGEAGLRIALEDELQGKTIEEDYADGDPVQVWDVQPGEEVLVVVESGDSPSIGDFLESAGNGNFTTGSTGNAVKLLEVIGAAETDDDSNKRVPARRL